MSKLSVFVIIYLFIWAPSAFAYLDPGSGSAIIGVITATIGALWYSVKSLFFRLSSKKRTNNSETPDHTTLVVFSEGKNYWGTFRPIVEELIRRKIPFRYRTLDLYDPGLKIESSYMNAKRLSSNAFGMAELSKIKSPIMLATTPNIGAQGYPLKRPLNVQNLIHIFHHVGDIATYKKHSLDHYDSIILAGDFQKVAIRAIEKKRGLKTKSLIPIGLPYLDDLYQHHPQTTPQALVRITVLVGSSWGNKGCLKQYGMGFIKKLLDAGYSVIIRPHPQSFKSEPEFIEQCKEQTRFFSSVQWDEDVSPAKSMSESQILISDTSSLRFDYAFLYKKPIITLAITKNNLTEFEADDLDTFWNDEAGSKIGITIDSSTINALPDIVEQVLNNYSPKDIIEFRNKTLRNFGNCTPHIVDYLIELQSRKSMSTTC